MTLPRAAVRPAPASVSQRDRSLALEARLSDQEERTALAQRERERSSAIPLTTPACNDSRLSTGKARSKPR